MRPPTPQQPGYIAMSFADSWGSAYNKSILAFTGRNKVAVRELEDVVKGTSELVVSLAELDKCNPKEARPADLSATLKAFSKQMANFAKARKKYDTVLDTAIKKTDKDLHPQALRELKVLKTQLALVASQIDSAYSTETKQAKAAMDKAGNQLTAAQDKLRAKGLDDAEVNAQSYLLKAKKLLLIYIPAGTVAMKKAVAAIQQIKADPTPATYKTAMDKGGRDLSQQFGNLCKVVDDPNAADWSLVKKLPDLRAYRATLADFGNGDKRSVPDDWTKTQILVRLKEFSDLVKAVAPVHDIVVAEVKKMK
jgi:hypothetical protein